MKGAYRLTTFEKETDLYAVKDYSFLSPMFFEMLKRELLKRGCLIEVSMSPLFGICEIRVPSAKCAFVPLKSNKEFCKCINLSRFANAKKAKAVKQRRIFTSNCLSTVLDGALENLSDAGKEHFKLEKIFINGYWININEAVEVITHNNTKEIFYKALDLFNQKKVK